MTQRYDSLLFDMDGTLWDAVDSYCAVWNTTIDKCCPGLRHVDYSMLAGMMGKPLKYIFEHIVGDSAPYDSFMEQLLADELEIMPRIGGTLYPGVKETIARLAATHRLFMVSNCNAGGLPVFLEYTGLKPYFTDAIAYGDTGRDKDYNIGLLVKRHGLKAPLYVGDTEGDCISAHRAGVPFAWATYGFGRGVADADHTLDSITNLLTIC